MLTHIYTQTQTNPHTHTEVFTFISFLQTEDCAHKSLYTQKLLHTDVFTHKRFYIYTEVFTHRSF